MIIIYIIISFILAFVIVSVLRFLFILSLILTGSAGYDFGEWQGKTLFQIVLDYYSRGWGVWVLTILGTPIVLLILYNILKY